LAAKSGNARARYFGEPGVICIGDNFEQLLDTVRPTGATIPNSARWARILNCGLN